MTRAERAQQLWGLLALAATYRQTLTYQMIAQLTGIARPGLDDFLHPLRQFCTDRGLPPLTCLVVSERHGLSGEGVLTAADVPPAQAQVFQHDWLQTRAPTVQQLEGVLGRTPEARSRGVDESTVRWVATEMKKRRFGLGGTFLTAILGALGGGVAGGLLGLLLRVVARGQVVEEIVIIGPVVGTFAGLLLGPVAWGAICGYLEAKRE